MALPVTGLMEGIGTAEELIGAGSERVGIGEAIEGGLGSVAKSVWHAGSKVAKFFGFDDAGGTMKELGDEVGELGRKPMQHAIEDDRISDLGFEDPVENPPPPKWEDILPEAPETPPTEHLEPPHVDFPQPPLHTIQEAPTESVADSMMRELEPIEPEPLSEGPGDGDSKLDYPDEGLSKDGESVESNGRGDPKVDDEPGETGQDPTREGSLKQMDERHMWEDRTRWTLHQVSQSLSRLIGQPQLVEDSVLEGSLVKAEEKWAIEKQIKAAIEAAREPAQSGGSAGTSHFPAYFWSGTGVGALLGMFAVPIGIGSKKLSKRSIERTEEVRTRLASQHFDSPISTTVDIDMVISERHSKDLLWERNLAMARSVDAVYAAILRFNNETLTNADAAHLNAINMTVMEGLGHVVESDGWTSQCHMTGLEEPPRNGMRFGNISFFLPPASRKISGHWMAPAGHSSNATVKGAFSQMYYSARHFQEAAASFPTNVTAIPMI